MTLMIIMSILILLQKFLFSSLRWIFSEVSKGGKLITNSEPTPSNGNGNGQKEVEIASFFKHIVEDTWLEFEGDSEAHLDVIQDLETELEERLGDDEFPSQDQRN